MVMRDFKNDVSANLVENQTNDSSETVKKNQPVEIINRLTNIGEGGFESFTLELLDPHGHSMIYDESAVERELTDEEIATLPTGPDPAVFST